MTTIDTMQTEQSTLMKLGRFHQLYKNNDDPIRAGKVKELIRKIVEKERVVAFCGHFSAGKSTMINTLIGENLLATSPIPTSANLVKIKVSQDHLVKVHFQDGTVKKYLSPFQLDEIKRMTKDGENIQKIEIELPSTNLPLGSIILDTPGIDSTDDAHRLATESAMHLADAVFTVWITTMFKQKKTLFTKEMANFGKDVYLIVNMIDKHQERVSMEQFKQLLNFFRRMVN